LKLVLASRNENKLTELRRALPAWEIALLATGDEPVEDGLTFLDNARIKALHGRAHARADDWVAGEDSGTEATFPLISSTNISRPASDRSTAPVSTTTEALPGSRRA